VSSFQTQYWSDDTPPNFKNGPVAMQFFEEGIELLSPDRPDRQFTQRVSEEGF
jgi:hypothetical protein